MIAPSLAAIALVGCARPDPTGRHPLDQTSFWHDYTRLANERALALAGDPARIWVAGAAGGMHSAADAERDAMAECARRRAARRILDACRMYAAGDRVLWRAD